MVCVFLNRCTHEYTLDYSIDYHLHALFLLLLYGMCFLNRCTHEYTLDYSIDYHLHALFKCINAQYSQVLHRGTFKHII